MLGGDFILTALNCLSLLLNMLEIYFMQDHIHKKDKSQRITVRIWLPSYTKRRKLGHVSIQTHIGGKNNTGNHISFWPKESIEKRNPFKSAKGEMKSLAHDKIQEQSSPDFKIYLYDLDVEKINQEFSLLKDRDIDWWILGSSFLSPEIKKNCAGLVYDLLQKGGIEQFNYKKMLFYFLAGSVFNITGSSYLPISILFILGKNYLIGLKTLMPSLLGITSGFYLTKKSEITNDFKLNYVTTLSSFIAFGITLSINMAVLLAALPLLFLGVLFITISTKNPRIAENLINRPFAMATNAALLSGIWFGIVPVSFVLINFLKLHFLDKSLLSPNDIMNFCLLKAGQEKKKYEGLKQSMIQGNIFDEKSKKFVLAYEKDSKKIKEVKSSWKDFIYRKTIASKWCIPITTSALLTATGFGIFTLMKKSNMQGLNITQANSSNTLKLNR